MKQFETLLTHRETGVVESIDLEGARRNMRLAHGAIGSLVLLSQHSPIGGNGPRHQMSTDLGITTHKPSSDPWPDDAVAVLKAIIENQEEQLKLQLKLLAALRI
jgi:hypothetical protein